MKKIYNIDGRFLWKLFVFGLILGTTILQAQISDKLRINRTNALQSGVGTPRYGVLNINNLSAWFRSDGLSNHSPYADNGLYFPRFTTGAIYQDGIMWGGKVYSDANLTQPGPLGQTIRVGGANYNVGTVAGRIIGTGASALPQNPNDADVRIFRIRRDYKIMSDEELRRDAANVNEITIQAVTGAQMQAVRDQYDKDWKEWPVSSGAPFIDRNGNGFYDAPPPFTAVFTVDSLITGGYDEPGIAGKNPTNPADQVLWHVYNDLDRLQTVALQGSEPIGLEIQKTIWGYNRTDALGNVYFSRTRIINKGGVDIDGNGTKGSFYLDSMYVAQWADADLGSAGDDLLGVDTLLGLGYFYNGSPTDNGYQKFNLPPPSVGYDLLSGPIVPSPGDSALFDLTRRYGLRNLGLSAFTYFSPGDPFSDPGRTYATGTLRWFRIFRGFAPTDAPDRYFPHPPGVTPGPFPYSGDPVTGTGILDGLGTSYSFPPGDRRAILTTGPFRLAPGDTQEVVLAFVGGLGFDRISSISVLRTTTRLAQSVYDNILRSFAPRTSVEVDYPNQAQSAVTILSDASGIPTQNIEGTLRRKDGTAVTTVNLFDDGLHGDGLASDGVFGNSVVLGSEREPLILDLNVMSPEGTNTLFSRHKEGITVVGPLVADSPTIFSDNFNNDGKANPGENIRYGLTLRNGTSYDLPGIRLTQAEPFDNNEISIGAIGTGATSTLTYNAANRGTYFSFSVPGNYPDTVYTVRLRATDGLGNMWSASVNFPVMSFESPVVHYSIPRTEGGVDGSFDIRIVDRSSVRDHLYVIRGIDSINVNHEPGFSLKDSTDGRILIAAAPLPDTGGHGVPVLDGFKILRGTIPAPGVGGMKDWSIPNGERRFTFADGYLNFEGFERAIGWNEPAYFFGTKTEKTVRAHELKNVLLRLAAVSSSTVTNPNAGNNPYGGWDENNPVADPNFSFGYRYLRSATAAAARTEFAPYIVNPSAGYAYQDYKQGVPLSAWDVEANPPVRLAVGHLENNTVTGLVDGKWWPGANGTGTAGNSGSTREWLFIFNTPYTGTTPVAGLQKDLLNNGLPVMWWLGVNRRGGNNFASGDEFLIYALHPLTARDVWVFNPLTSGPVAIRDEGVVPETFALRQNYPNPFNPTTTIEFSLPMASNVRLEIFDVLGRRVTLLVSETLRAGVYRRVWSPSGIASGMYFYRLQAGDWSDAKKLLLLK